MKLFSEDTLLKHSYKDSKWGYSHGKPNGKRKAGEELHNGIPDGEQKRGLNRTPIQTQSNAEYKQVIDENFKIKDLDSFISKEARNYKEYSIAKKEGETTIKNFFKDFDSSLSFNQSRIERASKALIDYRRKNK